MGFDYFFGYCDQHETHLYYTPFLWENNKRVYLDNKLIPTGTQLDEEPRKSLNYFPSRYPHATYAAMITHLDKQIGGLVSELKRLGISQQQRLGHSPLGRLERVAEKSPRGKCPDGTL
jgi:arylsulfatase A-like enzyme